MVTEKILELYILFEETLDALDDEMAHGDPNFWIEYHEACFELYQKIGAFRYDIEDEVIEIFEHNGVESPL
jgi:hypothetical protein